MTTIKILTIGGIPMYSGALNSTYDAMTNTQMEDFDGGDNTTDNIELSAITDSLVLSPEAFNIAHEVDGRSTCGLTIKDTAGAFTFSERQQFEYTDLDSNADFAGIVSSCQEIRIPGTNYVFHTIDAVDYTAILDWRIANYAVENTLAGDAVKALIATYLAEEGITQGIIEDGELLTQITIGNKTVKEAMDRLAEASGYIWYIDYDLKLYFHQRSLYAAAWTVTDGTDILSESLTITRNNPLYRNSESVLGGFEETDLMTDTFTGDAVTKTFPVGYAVSRIQDVVLTPLVGAHTHPSIGEKGAPGSYDFVYAVDSETVSFTVAPALGTTITITYYGLWRVQTKVTDSAKVTANAARQGFGSGKIEHAVVDETLVTSQAASEYANSKLAEYGVDGIVVSYKTTRSGLEVGTLQHFEYAGIDTDLLIVRVTQDASDNFTTYSVEAVSGPVNQSWENFFRSQFTPQTSISEALDSGAGVAQLYTYTHTFLDADRPDIFQKTALGARVDATTWPCFDPTDRSEYIEFRDNSSVVILRKPFTLVDGESSDVSFINYTYLGSSEGNGIIRFIAFYGGDSSTVANGSGVLLFAPVAVNLTKTILASYQINMTYINGTV